MLRPQQIDAGEHKGGELERDQHKPEYEQRVAHLRPGHATGDDGHNERRRDQGYAAHVPTQHQQARIHARVAATQGLAQNVAEGVHADRGKDKATHQRTGQRNDPRNADQFGRQHQRQRIAQEGPVHAALMPLTVDLRAMRLPHGDAGEKQQMHRDDGQKQQRLIADHQQKGQGEHRAAETQAGTHKTAPHEQQSDHPHLPGG